MILVLVFLCISSVIRLIIIRFVMSIYFSEEEKLKHPYYRLMEFRDDTLEAELNSWSRVDLIEWLCWNDRNGVYKDEDSMKEFENILSKKEAIEIITRQITEA